MQHDLLNEPLLTGRDSAGREQGYSLPGLLAAFGRGEIESLPRVQRHQADAIHMFLCYLAGIVLARSDRDEVAQDETFWCKRLEELGGGNDHAPWCLVVDDPERPAFMQSPLPDRKLLSAFTPKAATPDELDVLQAAKNHDIKGRRMEASVAEDWIHALISLQTMGGYLGAGNYGIARMNSGFGSRPCVGVITTGRVADRWQKDTQRLLLLRAELGPPDWPYSAKGKALLWTQSWDGTKSIALHELVYPVINPIQYSSASIQRK